MKLEPKRIDPKDLPPVGTVVKREWGSYKIVHLAEGFFADVVVVERCRGSRCKIGEHLAVPYKVLIEDWKRMQEKEGKG